MLGVIKFVIALVIILLFAAAGWIVFTHLRARRLGLPTPTFSSYFKFGSGANDGTSYSVPRPAPGGIVGWVNDKMRAFKNRNNRTAGGAYEEPLNTMGGGGAGARRGRGFGPLDPDEAWDARVGNEADAYGPGGYYEEQELGLHGDTGYAGANLAPTPGQAPAGFGEDRGRSRSRDGDHTGYVGGSKKGLDRRYDEEMGVQQPGGSGSGAPNPFGDDAEVRSVDLRGVSPRPIDTSAGGLGAKGHSKHDSGDSPTERRSMFRENM